MTTVLETTVANNICVGCGVCATMCPQSNLAIKWNSYGEYNPVKLNTCTHECGVCTKVCPQLTTTLNNEDVLAGYLYRDVSNISHCPEVGYYLNCGVGGVSDNDVRAACASGGLASWFLEQLLTQKIVDAVICVHHVTDGTKLFGYTVAKTVEDVRDSRGSAYYPNELSGVLDYVLEHEGRYAVIGLPCNIKAIRLAQRLNKHLRERIVLIAGLTCGRMKTAIFTDYVSHLAKLKEKPVYVQYRNTDLSRPPNPHRYVFRNASGQSKQISQKIGDGIYHSSIFGLTACRFCDDMFAECADVTFMDAWLPEYSKTEPRGTSIYVSRSPLVSKILGGGGENSYLSITELPIEKVIKSQGGLVRRDKITYMQHLYRKQGLIPPTKRFGIPIQELTGIDRWHARRYADMDNGSRKRFESVDGNLEKFHEWVELQWLMDYPIKASFIGIKLLQRIWKRLLK